MAITNPQTSAGNFYTIYGVHSRLKLGRFDSPAGPANVQNVLGIDPVLGNFDRKPQRGSISDRGPNVPSGYNIYGVPTYGAGKINPVTTWASDFSGSHPSGSFTFNTPLRPSKKYFTQLT